MNTIAPGPPLDLSAARFAVIWQAVGTHQALALLDDGVWFWTLAAPSQPWATLVGTFRCEPSEGERAALLDLAATIGTAADAGGTGGPSLVLAADGRTVRVDAGSQIAFRVTRAVTPLLSGTRPRPVSAVQVRATRIVPPGAPSMLGLTFTSIGAEPAVVRLDAEAVRLVEPDGAWRQVVPPRMGLVDGDGSLLDGLYLPATIPAGGTGAWVLAGAAATSGQQVRAAGSIRVSGWWPAASAPTPAFEVSPTVD